jgi:hypothetical protein
MVNSNSLPPQNIEAEESILGGLLLDPEAIGRVVDFMVCQSPPRYLRNCLETPRPGQTNGFNDRHQFLTRLSPLR